MRISIFIVARGRPSEVRSHRYLTGAKLLIPQAQVPEYGEFFEKKDLVSHPDLATDGEARDWALEQKGSCFFLRSDSTGLMRTWQSSRGRKRTRCSPDRATEVVHATALAAVEAGCFLFSFAATPHPKRYDATRPIRFGPQVTDNAFGVIKGSGMKWQDTPEEIAGAWISLLNAYQHRTAWIDTRFAFAFKNQHNDVSDEAYRLLRRNYGEAAAKVKPREQARKKHARVAVHLPYAV